MENYCNHYQFRPLLVTKEELTKMVFDDIKTFFNNLANADSFDVEEAKREYLVRVTLLSMVNPNEGFKFREFEIELKEYQEYINKVTPENNNETDTDSTDNLPND